MKVLIDLLYLSKNILSSLKKIVAHMCRNFQDSSFCHYSATIHSTHAELFILNNNHAHHTRSDFTLSFIVLISHVFSCF